MRHELAYISIINFVSFKDNPPIFLITLLKSCPHWWVVFLGQRIFFFSFLGVLAHLSDILLVCSSYRRGQWAGHRAHPNFWVLSSLPCLVLGVLVRCVSWPKERPSSTVHARGTKWKRYLRSWRFLAQTSTLKVRFSRFACVLCDFCVTTILVHYTQFAQERLTTEDKSGQKCASSHWV